MTNPRDDLMALAPCPFCHGAPYLHEQEGQRPEDKRYSVHCDGCDATHDTPSKDAAVAAWNRRTAASRPATQVVDREAVAQAICKSGKFETGQGTCALICMDQLGDVRKKGCGHCARVHGKLADAILSLLRTAAPAPDAKGEPVAWQWRGQLSGEWHYCSKRSFEEYKKDADSETRALYTHPPKSPDISAEEMRETDASEIEGRAIPEPRP